MGKSKRMIEGQLNLFEMFGQEEESQETPIKEVKGAIKIDKVTSAGKFEACKQCWCKDCKHNTINEGIPRSLGGQELPCPACDFCVDNQSPEICIIGSAKEGCQVRAAEEGMIEE